MIYGLWLLCKKIVLFVKLKNRITDQHQENGFVGQKSFKCAEKDDNNNSPVPQPPKKSCERYRECYKDVIPGLRKSKKGEMYVFYMWWRGWPADDMLNPNHTWISKC